MGNPVVGLRAAIDSSTSSLSSLSTDRSTGSSQSITKSKPTLSTQQHICNVLETLREGRLPPVDLHLKVLNPVCWPS
ncbi:hypothetical protein SCLCIDRAFT_846059 [Scleroderma citrinum Foug A]|uniref:Uncharacterized protein n=1 Tax=Scleroderma citrinum Foug A TaxID=1036808 RepID=A0A0C3E219_9AGAM|nr:hypothetical protein SCLCIDRAFT_846059 [Scleroderma citrinum Foug A]